jgi:hypothetical protein
VAADKVTRHVFPSSREISITWRTRRSGSGVSVVRSSTVAAGPTVTRPWNRTAPGTGSATRSFSFTGPPSAIQTCFQAFV